MMFSYTAKTHNTAVVLAVFSDVPVIRIVPFVITVIDIIRRDSIPSAAVLLAAVLIPSQCSNSVCPYLLRRDRDDDSISRDFPSSMLPSADVVLPYSSCTGRSPLVRKIGVFNNYIKLLGLHPVSNPSSSPHEPHSRTLVWAFSLNV